MKILRTLLTEQSEGNVMDVQGFVIQPDFTSASQSAAGIDAGCHCIRGFCMPTLVRIDSKPLHNRSVSCELTATFVTQWKAYPISTSLICTTG
jgi:hypothetical protein